MKILILGHGGHGKGLAAKILALKLGVKATSSSWFVCKPVVYPKMKKLGYKYNSAEECYKDRRNHRDLWKSIISDYNSPADRLSKDILVDHHIYDGMRCRAEFESSKGLFDTIVWVDRSEYEPNDSSNELTQSDCDVIINNNGTETDLFFEISKL